eukprot:440503_1
MTKIETDIKDLIKREAILIKETKCQRFIRLLMQFIRSLFVFSFLIIYPIIILYVIIPNYKETNYQNNIAIGFIGSYLIIILCLQIFGTYRALRSYEEKRNVSAPILHFKPMQFHWNIGSIIAISLLIYEMLQLSVFASHIIENASTSTTQTSTATDIVGIYKMTQMLNNIFSFVSKICYLSLDFIESYNLEYYSYFNFICVCGLLLFFVFRFEYELKTYGRLKYIQQKDTDAQMFYFHSFVGTIIYGHGTLQNVGTFSSKIVSLLSDALFLGICEKLILVMTCDSNNNLLIQPNIKCWIDKHQYYSLFNLILIGYYIPISTMISPMFMEEEDENNEDNDEEIKQKPNWKRFLSFSNTIRFVKPFVSLLTVSKCFMLIGAIFISGGSEFGTIICEGITMIILLSYTLFWSISNLKLYGLTQNEPGFPFCVSLIRSLGFFVGLTSCIIEIFRFYGIIDSTFDYFVLFVAIIISSGMVIALFLKFYSRFNALDDDVDVNVLLKYDDSNNIVMIKEIDKIKQMNTQVTQQIELQQTLNIQLQQQQEKTQFID